MATTRQAPPKRARLRSLVADLARSEDELRGVGSGNSRARQNILRHQERLIAELRCRRQH